MQVLGYGSLMNPESLIGRFADDIEKTADDIYQSEQIEPREDVINSWEGYQDRIDFIPVTVAGFKRVYSFKSWRGGAMLEAVRTGEESDWMNAVIVRGLASDEKEAITETEPHYDVFDLDDEHIDLYPEWNGAVDGAVRIHAIDSADDFEPCFRCPNPVYFGRILRGLGLLENEWGVKLIDQFRKDFLETTHEQPLSTGSKELDAHVTSTEKYRSRAALGVLMEA